MLGHRSDVLCRSLGGDGVGGQDFMVLFLGWRTEYFRWILLGIARGLCLGGSSRPGLDRVQIECFRYNFSAICPRVCIWIPHLINKAKNSNSSGYDDINMKFLKKCKIKLAPHITHMINTILITKKFPRIFKISRILPLSKPTLDRNFMESYRPVNNLCCLEKLAKAQILKYLEIFSF